MKIECTFNKYKKFYFETNNKNFLKKFKLMESFKFTDLITNEKVTIFKNRFNNIFLKQIK